MQYKQGIIIVSQKATTILIFQKLVFIQKSKKVSKEKCVLF